MGTQRFEVNDEELEKLLAVMQPELDGLFNAALKLRGKLVATGAEWDTTNGINYALTTVCQAFGLPASMHGWLEARSDERRFTLHTCGAVHPNYVGMEWQREVWSKLEHMAKMLAVEPYSVMESAAKFAKKLEEAKSKDSAST